jgi:hypothetical protein
MKQQYQEISFRKASLVLIHTMNDILDDFRSQGYVVTVRQLYYQMVARDLIENTEKSYKKITGLVNDARMAGVMDWDMIEDRTRSFERRGHWDSPAGIVRACAQQYHIDMWDNQDTRIFVIVEKEALAGVLQRPCYKWDVPLLAARGYPSVTVVREFVERDVIPVLERGQNIQILHFGDHDPSGLDMTRDLRERIELFADTEFREYDGWVNIKRMALNMDQVEEQRPPPNPAKVTDSRFADYEERYGSESWELDALSPKFLDRLVEDALEEHRDDDLWAEKEEERQDGRDRIAVAAKQMEEA